MKIKKYKKVSKRAFLINREHKIMRGLQRKNNRKKHNGNIENANVATFKSRLFKFLNEKRFKIYMANKKKGVKIVIPKKFSFITNPNDTIKTIKKVFYCLNNLKIKILNLDYSQCEEIGMCASAVLDIMVMEAKKTRKDDMIIKGNYPVTDEARTILCISGLVKHLGLSNIELDSVRRLDIMSNLESDEMSEKVVEYYDQCLETQGYMLSDVGKSNFANMVGEVIDNAEQYGGNFKSWHVMGHFNIQNQKSIGKCRLVLMNFGNSIYESLKDDSTTGYTKNLLQRHTQKTKGLFNLDFNEEVLWTLYALQQNVSKSRDSKDGDRGNGTIKLLKAFSEIGETKDGDKPKMAIISGRSYILLDGTYSLIEETIENKKVNVIAFNKNNDLNELPDKRYVQILKENFPGTIISLEFYLDRNYMSQVLRKE